MSLVGSIEDIEGVLLHDSRRCLDAIAEDDATDFSYSFNLDLNASSGYNVNQY